MKVSVCAIIVVALCFEIKAQINYIPVLIPTYNISDIGWGNPAFNKTHWNFLALNKTQGDWAQLNKTHWNPTAVNKTHWDWTALNKTQWNLTALNQTHFTVPAFNSTTRYVYNYTTNTGDVLIGHILYRDRLLYNSTFSKSSRWWSGREKTFEYPKDLKDSYYRHEIISAIRIYNRNYREAHSEAEITSGGVGQRYVKIRMSSSWGRGFKYEVQIFGH